MSFYLRTKLGRRSSESLSFHLRKRNYFVDYECNYGISIGSIVVCRNSDGSAYSAYVNFRSCVGFSSIQSSTGIRETRIDRVTLSLALGASRMKNRRREKEGEKERKRKSVYVCVYS